MVVSSLKCDTVTLIKNMNGNHVAQRCLQYLRPEHSEVRVFISRNQRFKERIFCEYGILGL